MANILNCKAIDNTTDLVACLRQFDAEALDLAAHMGNGTDLSFNPVVDGDLVPLPPSECFQQGYG